jgi:diguanylate cyclase (GGDEF)-like protein/PAS domain S-box-containing protein
VFDLFYCIRDQHDPRLVAAAALVCAIACATAILMIRRATQARARAKRNWLVAGGLATGFGIWSTHFIAMLGYDPGVVAGYRPALTVASLAVVLATTMAAFRLAVAARRRRTFALAACLAGGGFAAMHYLGMAALEMPARIQWSPGYLALSVACAVLPLHAVLRIAVRKRGAGSAALAAGLMVLAIVGLHFSGMTAITLVPARMQGGAILLSPSTMSLVIGSASVVLLGLCLAAALAAQRANAAIAQSERQFSMLVRGVTDYSIYMLDLDGRITNWNAGAAQLKGYSREAVIGRHFAMFYSEEDRAAARPEAALETARTEGKYTGQGWRLRADGSRFWAHVTIEQSFDPAGRPIGFAKITRDMTRFKEDQDRLVETSRQLDAALEHMHHGLCLFDADERLVLRNRRYAELWGLPPDACPPGTTLTELVRVSIEARNGRPAEPEQLAAAREHVNASLSQPDQPPLIYDTGDNFCLVITSRPMPQGGWVTTFEDITERRRSEAQIAHLAHHDVLTGLPNRASFNRWMTRETEIARTRGEQVAVVAIDLDRFKDINDSHGHAMGDAVLGGFARALEEAIDEGDIAARLGGDEFAVARRLSGPGDLSDFIARLERVPQLCREGQDVALTGASMGVAIMPGDADTPEGLLNNADLAMYRAKASHEQSICFYEAGMDEQARRRRQLGNDLRHAVARGEFRVLYQEQRSVTTRELTGYEALLRWSHPHLGEVSPVDFIPVAEENGEIVGIGEWVLRSACAEAARWPGQLRVAVNLSPIQLLKPDLPEMVHQILLETGLPPRRLELEITESAIISDKNRALHSLRRIKALGVSVAMDDFGTGYSSLDTLHSFPFDKIKIDKSFLLESGRSPQARAIVKAVVALGRSLVIPVLAEGVETEEQLDLLVQEGCEGAQGYYFGRPSPAPSLGPAPGARQVA